MFVLGHSRRPGRNRRSLWRQLQWRNGGAYVDRGVRTSCRVGAGFLGTKATIARSYAWRRRSDASMRTQKMPMERLKKRHSCDTENGRYGILRALSILHLWLSAHFRLPDARRSCHSRKHGRPASRRAPTIFTSFTFPSCSPRPPRTGGHKEVPSAFISFLPALRCGGQAGGSVQRMALDAISSQICGTDRGPVRFDPKDPLGKNSFGAGRPVCDFACVPSEQRHKINSLPPVIIVA